MDVSNNADRLVKVHEIRFFLEDVNACSQHLYALCLGNGSFTTQKSLKQLPIGYSVLGPKLVIRQGFTGECRTLGVVKMPVFVWIREQRAGDQAIVG